MGGVILTGLHTYISSVWVEIDGCIIQDMWGRGLSGRSA